MIEPFKNDLNHNENFTQMGLFKTYEMTVHLTFDEGLDSS